jgi:hypothetical protein
MGGDKICMKDPAKNFVSSQAFRVHNDIANTGVQSKHNMDQGFRRYNTFNKEKGVLPNFHDHISVDYKLLRCILTLQMQGHIQNNMQFLKYL